MILSSHPRVIHIRRPIEILIGELNAGTLEEAKSISAHRPAYEEPIHTVWQRRLPLFETCSTHVFCAHDTDWKLVCSDFERLVTKLSACPALMAPSLHPGSFFVCLTLPDVTSDEESLKAALKVG